MATTVHASENGPPDPAEPRRGWTVGRVMTVLVVLALIGFWAWILSGAPRRASPDRLSNRNLVAASARRCRAARQVIDALPSAPESKTAVERAAVVDQATDELDRLVADLTKKTPPSGADAVRFKGWLKEWRLYLQDRRQYTAKLRVNERSQFLLNENPAGDSIDRSIQAFADVNDMPVCATPGDVG